MDYAAFKTKLQTYVETNPSNQDIVAFVQQHIEEFPKIAVSIGKASFIVMKDSHTAVSLKVIEPFIDKIADTDFLKVLKKRYELLNETAKATALQEQIKKISKQALIQKCLKEFEDNKNTHGFEYALAEVEKFTEKYYYLRRTILKKIYAMTKDLYPKESLSLGDEIVLAYNDVDFAKKLADRHRLMGNTEKATTLLEIIR